MFSTGKTVGLAEWIIDDTSCLLYFIIFLLLHQQLYNIILSTIVSFNLVIVVEVFAIPTVPLAF